MARRDSGGRRPSPAGGPSSYDVIVIGGGVIGCAVLRELSRYELRLLLLEKEADLAEGITKANSGVIHAGFNVPPGSLKARTNVAGLGKIYRLAAELHVPHRKTGKLVIALTDDERPRLEELKAQGEQSGTPDLEVVGASEIRAIEPLARGRWALYSPHTGIISPYEFTISLAECARRNGARVLLEATVESVEFRGWGFHLGTPKGSFSAPWVVNSAGLFADEVACLAGIRDYTIFPYRGEYLVTDKDPGFALRLPIYPVPPRDDPGLGIHITPTIEGNVLIGPSAERIFDRRDTASTRSVMDRLKNKAARLVPELKRAPLIHSYAGIRPKIVGPKGGEKFGDFVVEESPVRPGWINLIGIESPGLTSSPAIADMVVGIIGARRDLRLKPGFLPELAGSPRFAFLGDRERAERVRKDPDWGEMVCRCEHVTRAEVVAALRNPFGARTMDAVKRRTRCGMGRCQGGFCTPRIVEIMQEEGVSLEKITKRGGASRLFYGRIKS
jgi:glycerol-3-phosphate dehydrogenase